jgi:hypothetical protein
MKSYKVQVGKSIRSQKRGMVGPGGLLYPDDLQNSEIINHLLEKGYIVEELPSMAEEVSEKLDEIQTKEEVKEEVKPKPKAKPKARRGRRKKAE